VSDARRARDRRTLVLRYYGFTLFFSLLFWLPIFYEFQRRIGLSDQRIFAIQSLYYLVFCALELPTGWFADRVGHQTSLVLGSATLVASHLAPSLSPTQGGMLAHYLLIALARSLVSGASSAYAYERLVELGDREGFKAVEGRARALALVAKIVAWTFVGALMNRWLTGPYWLTTLAALASLGFALTLPRAARAPGRPARAGRAVTRSSRCAFDEPSRSCARRPRSAS
jgi:MFS family permease